MNGPPNKNRRQPPSAGRKPSSANAGPKNPRKRNPVPQSSNRNRMRGNPTTSTEVRTPGTIINRLAKSMKAATISSPYVDCRMGCIANIRNPPTIPDGNGGRCLASCIYTSDRLSFTSATTPQTFRVLLLPTYPFGGAVLNPGGNVPLNVNGVSSTNGIYLPIAVDPSVLAQGYMNTIPGAKTVDPYNATACRLVSRTTKITYTGPVTTCSGVVRVYENPVAIVPGVEATSTSSSTTAPTTGTYISNYNSNANTATRFAPLNTPCDFLDFTDSPSAPMNTATYRPEQGVTLMMRHKTNKYEQTPLANMMRAITLTPQAQTGTSLSLTNFIAEYSLSPVNGYGGGYAACDNDWIAQVVSFENVNQDASFLVETMACYEWTVQAGNAFRQFEREAAPLNTAAMKAVENGLKGTFSRPNAY